MSHFIMATSQQRRLIPAANLELWLDAASITGLSDNDPVGTWSDKSGEGNDATQGTSANRPTYRTNILSGKPVVRFDGINSHLFTPITTWGATDPISVFIIANHNGGDGRFVSKDKTGAPGSFIFRQLNADRISFQVRDSNSNDWKIAAYFPTFPLPFSLLTGTWSPANPVRLYTDGTIEDTTANVAEMNTNNLPITIGADSENNAENLDGDIAELIIYRSVLSNDDRNKVHDYLGKKWLGW